MTISLYGDIGSRVGVYAVADMLKHAQPILCLQLLGLSKPIPKNHGDQIKFRRAKPWGDIIIGGAANSKTGSIANWVPPTLTEGVPPTSTAIVYQDVSATLQQYGAFTTITDKVNDLHEDPVLQDQTVLAGENAAETLELVTYNVVRAGTNVTYLGGAGRANVNAPVTLAAIRGVTRTLRANRARFINKILGPSINIDTKPVEAGFVAVGHTDLEADIRNMVGFVPVAKYANRQPICPEELGSVETVRFILSPLFAPVINAGAAIGGTGLKSTGGTNIDVYPMIVFGQDAFGCTPLKGMNAMDIKVLNPGVPRSGDPLGQIGTVGWKAWYTAVRLDETWMCRIEAGVTAL